MYHGFTGLIVISYLDLCMCVLHLSQNNVVRISLHFVVNLKYHNLNDRLQGTRQFEFLCLGLVKIRV